MPDEINNSGGGNAGSSGGAGTLFGDLGGNQAGAGNTPNAGNVGAGSAGDSGSSAGSGSPWYSSLWGADGKINKTAFDSLPDHLKPHKATFSKYDSADAFFSGYANLSTLAGKKALAPLPENAPDDAKAERSKLLRQINGVPDTWEGYGVKKPEGVDDSQWNGEYVNSAMQIMHKHNIPPAAVHELMKFDMEFAGKIREGAKLQSEAQLGERIKTGQEELRKEFGQQYKEKLTLAQRVAEQNGFDYEKDRDLLLSPKVIKLLAQIGEGTSEDRLVGSNAPSNASGGDDRAKALDIVNNPSNPLYAAFHDSNHPQHAYAMQVRSNFNKSAFARSQKK